MSPYNQSENNRNSNSKAINVSPISIEAFGEYKVSLGEQFQLALIDCQKNVCYMASHCFT